MEDMVQAASSFNWGVAFAIAGASLAAILGGIGSSIGVGITGQAGAGVATERPEEFGKILLLEALPGTQGIYGFLGAFLMLNFFKIGAPDGFVIDVGTGMMIFFAALPVGVAGLFSGMYQGKVSAAGLNILAKNPQDVGKAIILSAMVETYAILGLLITILLFLAIQSGLTPVV
jgi:V/A-type H+/Na+-transporting ATPase subunit K